jgi:hypothetical protein
VCVCVRVCVCVVCVCRFVKSLGRPPQGPFYGTGLSLSVLAQVLSLALAGEWPLCLALLLCRWREHEEQQHWKGSRWSWRTCLRPASGKAIACLRRTITSCRSFRARSRGVIETSEKPTCFCGGPASDCRSWFDVRSFSRSLSLLLVLLMEKARFRNISLPNIINKFKQCNCCWLPFMFDYPCKVTVLGCLKFGTTTIKRKSQATIYIKHLCHIVRLQLGSLWVGSHP